MKKKKNSKNNNIELIANDVYNSFDSKIKQKTNIINDIIKKIADLQNKRLKSTIS